MTGKGGGGGGGGSGGSDSFDMSSAESWLMRSSTADDIGGGFSVEGQARGTTWARTSWSVTEAASDSVTVELTVINQWLVSDVCFWNWAFHCGALLVVTVRIIYGALIVYFYPVVEVQAVGRQWALAADAALVEREWADPETAVHCGWRLC